MEIRTWDELRNKYTEEREEMSEEREKEFVSDCFTCYENEGFAKRFWSPFSSVKNRIGQQFEVIERCTADGRDLCTLPAWKIRFEDGAVMDVLPEEIIPREMRHNGCTLEEID